MAETQKKENKKLVIIGCSGNAAVIYSTVLDINRSCDMPEWEVLGFLDDDKGKKGINGCPIIGPITKEKIQELLLDDSVYFFWTLVSVKNRETFQKLFFDLSIPEERMATLIHPTAVVSEIAKIGYGVSIQPHVIVGPLVIIDNFVNIFAGAMIGHNATLRDFSYIANNGCIGAYVTLDKGAYVGTNASLIENVKIGKWSVVGMGSVVIKSVDNEETVVGNPAKVLSSR